MCNWEMDALTTELLHNLCISQFVLCLYSLHDVDLESGAVCAYISQLAVCSRSMAGLKCIICSMLLAKKRDGQNSFRGNIVIKPTATLRCSSTDSSGTQAPSFQWNAGFSWQGICITQHYTDWRNHHQRCVPVRIHCTLHLEQAHITHSHLLQDMLNWSCTQLQTGGGTQ